MLFGYVRSLGRLTGTKRQFASALLPAINAGQRRS